MSPGVRPRTAVQQALRLSGLLVVLAGLFGMHGLGNHSGMGTSGMMGSPGGARTEMADSAARDDATVHDLLTTTAQRIPAAMVVDASGRVGMGAAGMCLAVLVLSLAWLVLRLAALRPRPLPWLVARPTRAPVSRGRDPDPPSLTRLSIQRC